MGQSLQISMLKTTPHHRRTTDVGLGDVGLVNKFFDESGIVDCFFFVFFWGGVLGGPGGAFEIFHEGGGGRGAKSPPFSKDSQGQRARPTPQHRLWLIFRKTGSSARHCLDPTPIGHQQKLFGRVLGPAAKRRLLTSGRPWSGKPFRPQFGATSPIKQKPVASSGPSRGSSMFYLIADHNYGNSR